MTPRRTTSSSSCSECSAIQLHAGEHPVESFLRGVQIMHGQQRPASFFLKGHRGHGAAVVTFLLVRPDANEVLLRGTCHGMPWSWRHPRQRTDRPPARTSASQESRDMPSDRRPPSHEQFGRVTPQNEAGRAADGARDDQLTLGLSFHRRTLFRSRGLVSLFAAIDSLLAMKSSTTLSSSSKREAQSWRYRSSHAVSSSKRRMPSLQVRTRPIFSG